MKLMRLVIILSFKLILMIIGLFLFGSSLVLYQGF